MATQVCLSFLNAAIISTSYQFYTRGYLCTCGDQRTSEVIHFSHSAYLSLFGWSVVCLSVCFKTGSLIGPELTNWRLISEPTDPASWTVSPYWIPTLGLQLHTITPGFLLWMLAIKLGSLCICGKHISHWAISPPPPILHFFKDKNVPTLKRH